MGHERTEPLHVLLPGNSLSVSGICCNICFVCLLLFCLVLGTLYFFSFVNFCCKKMLCLSQGYWPTFLEKQLASISSTDPLREMCVFSIVT